MLIPNSNGIKSDKQNAILLYLNLNNGGISPVSFLQGPGKIKDFYGVKKEGIERSVYCDGDWKQLI